MSKESGANLGLVRGKHYTEYVDEVKALRRSGQDDQAEALLLELIAATEAEARAMKSGVAPWYFEQVAIIRRKRKDDAGEVEILERYAREMKAPGAMPPVLLKRLESARQRVTDA
jgi:hypothetical protein